MSNRENTLLVGAIWLAFAAPMAWIWGPLAWAATTWDTDDFMRLVQVRDWLTGQSWFDLTQYRLNPPGGTAMHWSRLPDIPLALVALALAPALGSTEALVAAGLVVPPVYYLLVLAPIAVAARLLLGRARAPVALIAAIGASAAILQFAPGRVDHHGLQLAALTIVMTCLLIGAAHRRWRRWIVWAGVPIGVSLWIGIETLPFHVLFLSALGVAWCRLGGDLALRGAQAAALAAATAGIALVASAKPAAWSDVACDAFSILSVAVMALVALGFAALHAATRILPDGWRRLTAGAVAGLACAAAFAGLFPQCLGGGYAAMDPYLEQHWLAYVFEAAPGLTILERVPFLGLGRLCNPVIGLGYCLWRIARAGGRTRLVWGMIAMPLGAAVLLSLFWQMRVITIAQVLALLPIAALVCDLWRWLARRVGPALGVLCLLPVLVAFSPLPWWGVESLYRRVEALNLPRSPLPSTAQARCSGRRPVTALPADRPARLLGYIDLGPMLLFTSPHATLAAPYHRDVDGLKTTIEIFRSDDDAWIRRRLAERGIGWIVTCPGAEEVTAYKTERGDGLAERLARDAVPDWLQRQPDQPGTGLRVYRVGQ